MLIQIPVHIMFDSCTVPMRKNAKIISTEWKNARRLILNVEMDMNEKRVFRRLERRKDEYLPSVKGVLIAEFDGMRIYDIGEE